MKVGHTVNHVNNWHAAVNLKTGIIIRIHGDTLVETTPNAELIIK